MPAKKTKNANKQFAVWVRVRGVMKHTKSKKLFSSRVQVREKKTREAEKT